MAYLDACLLFSFSKYQDETVALSEIVNYQTVSCVQSSGVIKRKPVLGHVLIGFMVSENRSLPPLLVIT